jgi:hypothetical protein
VDDETRRDLEATVGARRELGAAHDEELIDGFLERLDKRLGEPRGKPARREPDRRNEPFVLTLVTLGVSIPLLGIAAGTAGLAGIIVIAIALVAVMAILHERS